MHIPPDFLGLAAGSLITASSLPKVAERTARLAAGRAAFSLADLTRDSLQGIGNGLWVYVGLSSGLFSVAAFCGLNGLLMLVLVFLNLRGGAKPRRIPNTRSSA